MPRSRNRTIERFGTWRMNAMDYERRCRMRGLSPAMAALNRRVMGILASQLDDAWDAVELIAAKSPEDAQLVCEHYIFCDDWHDVAARHAISYDKVKKRAYAALKEIDSDA